MSDWIDDIFQNIDPYHIPQSVMDTLNDQIKSIITQLNPEDAEGCNSAQIILERYFMRLHHRLTTTAIELIEKNINELLDRRNRQSNP